MENDLRGTYTVMLPDKGLPASRGMLVALT